MQQIFPILIIIWVFIIALKVGAYLDKKSKNGSKLVIQEKFCPPHKWLWEEQIGMEGTFYIRCQRCRRLPGWEGEK